MLARGRNEGRSEELDAAGVLSKYGCEPPLFSSPVSFPTNFLALALVPVVSPESLLFVVTELLTDVCLSSLVLHGGSIDSLVSVLAVVGR